MADRVEQVIGNDRLAGDDIRGHIERNLTCECTAQPSWPPPRCWLRHQRLLRAGGITKDGAKKINAVRSVPVPKFSIVCGGSLTAGNLSMYGPAFGPSSTWL